MEFFNDIIERPTEPTDNSGKGMPTGNDADILKLILDHIPMSLYWKDSELKYRGSNKKFIDMISITMDELLGKTDMDINAKEAAEVFRKEDMEFLSGARKDMYFVDKYIPLKDGQKIWVRTYKIPIYNKDGNIMYIMGLIQDVTKIKSDEIALAESESKIRTILNATDDPIVFIDTDYKILAANGSFVNDFCREKPDATGMAVQDVLSFKFCSILRVNIENAFKIKVPHHFDLSPEESNVNKYFEVSVYPVFASGGIIGSAVYARDITRRKYAEEMLLKRSEQLQEAMTEAEKASKTKSEFLSRMSHEIRTPISAIIGMTKIASGSDDPDKIKDCLQKIESSSKHLLGIINDVLDMSKIEANKFTLSSEIFQFEHMLMDITNVVNVRANEKRQNFEIILDSSLPDYFCADELRLRQVITNLLSNAIKFTPEHGTVRLSINNSGIEDGICTVGVVVSDTGIGITPEQIKRLFSPFEQADGSISRKYGGTGLGLVICKKIVEMMDGNIRIESQPGKGSQFIFDVKIKVHYNTARSEKERTIKFSDLRALIVDDSFETREYLSKILERFGVSAETAHDGYNAVKKTEDAETANKPFNVFFIDWSMPGIDGIETTRRIKSLMSDSAGVIMISLTEWENIEQEALDAGVERFIPKPLFPSTILSALDEIAGTSAPSEIKSNEEGVPDLTGYHFLLAEDIEINREIAAALLSPTNVTLDFAVNGKEAVEKFNANKSLYNLILMDIHMPEMDGYEATKLIRSNDDKISQNIPILAMTADAFKEDIDKCKAVGMDDHIAKPINDSELYKKIMLCNTNP